MKMNKLAGLVAELLHAGERADETGLTMYVYEGKEEWHTTAIAAANETAIVVWPGGATSLMCDLCDGRKQDAETNPEDAE